MGVDILPLPGVDYVVDLRKEPLPFPDKSVEAIFSSHFLEHLGDPTKIFAEFSRVAQDGAIMELWTPYAWSNPAFITDHKMFFNEDHYLHITNWFVEFWEKIIKCRWLLKEIQYVIDAETLMDLKKNNVSVAFALKYFKGIAKEFCVHIEVRHGYIGNAEQPIRTYSLGRETERFKIDNDIAIAKIFWTKFASLFKDTKK
ncbi:MAG: methyltransferase family [Geobacteraceae bacterium]|nr:MAG: methyltransferase family [Geobacteraceae bacterium]